MAKNKEKIKIPVPEDRIGARITKARRDAKLTSTELSTRLGITRATLSNYEKGKHKVDATMLRKICTELKVSPNRLIFGVDNVKQAKFPKYRLFDPDNTGEINVIAGRFSIGLMALEKDDRDAFLSLVASLLEAQMGTKSLGELKMIMDALCNSGIIEELESNESGVLDDITKTFADKINESGIDISGE